MRRHILVACCIGLFVSAVTDAGYRTLGHMGRLGSWATCQESANHKDDDQTPNYYYCAPLSRFLLYPVVDGLWWVGDHVERYHDAVIALGTLIIAGFTGTLWWVTWGMVRIAEQQRTDTIRAIEAAEKSANAAEQTFTHGQRPWVFVFNVSEFKPIWDQDGAEYFPVLPFEVANYGGSPAILEWVEMSLGNEGGFPLQLKRIDTSHSLASSPILSVGSTRYVRFR